MPPHERLEVYREQFWIRHLASLDEDFPTLTWVLGGRDAFRALAIGVPRRHSRPVHGTSSGWARTFPASSQTTRVCSDDALARDAVRLDWAFMEAFDAPDSPPFDARVLASTPEDAWPTARIDLHASLRLLALAYPVHELRDAVQRRRGGRAPRVASRRTSPSIATPRASSAPVAVEPLAFELLEALRAGTALGEACEAAARVERTGSARDRRGARRLVPAVDRRGLDSRRAVHLRPVVRSALAA